MKRPSSDTETGYPVLLFTISKDSKKVGLYRDQYDEKFMALSNNAAELAGMLEDEGYNFIFRDEEDTEYDLDDGYFRSVELVWQAIQKDHPEFTLGKIEVAQEWYPQHLRHMTLVDTRD